MARDLGAVQDRRRATPARGRPIWRYYGVAGFTSEVLGILDRMKAEPQKGAAMFRNRVTTMQHAELWRETASPA